MKLMSSHLSLGYPNSLFPSDSPTKIEFPCLNTMRVTCSANLINISLIIRNEK
jgi:hypothetical protein